VPIGNPPLALAQLSGRDICKHVLGIAIRLKKFSVIPEAKNVKLAEKILNRNSVTSDRKGNEMEIGKRELKTR